MTTSLLLVGQVPGRGCSMISAKSEDMFQPRRLVVPDEVAEHFVIVDVRVDGSSQLITYDALPASVFSASSREEVVDFWPLSPGGSFCLVVVNVGDVERYFEAEISGREATSGDLVFVKLGKTVGRTVVGLGRHHVPAGEWLDVEVMPQMSFCPERLVVPAGYARGFVVEDVQVRRGGSELLGSCPCSVPADDYGVGAEGRLELSTGGFTVVGDRVRVKVSNRALEDRVFGGAVFGTYRH